MPPVAGRSPFVEDLFEYGSRACFWRVLRLFEERRPPLTCWAVGLALKRDPEAGHAMAEAGHEVASHCWRWIDYSGMPEDEVTYLKAAFDHLYREGDREPKMMSVGLH